MDSRERVERCLKHQQPDRIPIDLWASKEIRARLMRHFGVPDIEPVLQRFGVDFRYLEGPVYIGPPLAVNADGSSEDHFGVPRRIMHYGKGEKAGTYSEVCAYPLAQAQSVDEIESYPRWPNPDWFDYDRVREQARRARATGKVVVFMGDRLNRCAQLKPGMYLRGVEQILMDLYINPEIAAAIFRRISDFYSEYARRTLESADGNVDILFTGDDFGMQENTLLPLGKWREFLRHGFKRFIDIGHRFGCRVAHHTCGYVRPLIPDFIECGLDILNPLQPEVRGLDLRAIKREFGDRISFHGGISIQRTLPYGTPEEVRNEVRQRAAELAQGGGYIFCTAHDIQPDTPTENINALFAAYLEYDTSKT
jgi:uroporphyrinogen decarboxylase